MFDLCRWLMLPIALMVNLFVDLVVTNYADL